MRYPWLVVMVVFGLAGSPAAIAAEPMADHAARDAESGSAQSWGDPEENQQGSETWTWFGMGYERRTRAGDAPSAPGSNATNGQGEQLKSGRR